MVPDIYLVQYAALWTAVRHTSSMQNDTNESEYKIFKNRISWRVVALKMD